MKMIKIELIEKIKKDEPSIYVFPLSIGSIEAALINAGRRDDEC